MAFVSATSSESREFGASSASAATAKKTNIDAGAMVPHIRRMRRPFNRSAQKRSKITCRPGTIAARAM